MKLEYHLTVYRKIYLKWIKNLNVKADTIFPQYKLSATLYHYNINDIPDKGPLFTSEKT